MIDARRTNLASTPLPSLQTRGEGELLWSRCRNRRSLLKCFQFYQCPLERDDTTGREPWHRRLAVPVSPCPCPSHRVRVGRRRRRLRAALLDERAGVAEHFREAALLAVQPFDLGLERAERDFERAADKAAREDVGLLVVEAAVDDALLCPAELVVCGLTKPTSVFILFGNDERIGDDRARTVLSPRRALGWKLGLVAAMTSRDSTTRFCLRPKCQG